MIPFKRQLWAARNERRRLIAERDRLRAENERLTWALGTIFRASTFSSSVLARVVEHVQTELRTSGVTPWSEEPEEESSNDPNATRTTRA